MEGCGKSMQTGDVTVMKQGLVQVAPFLGPMLGHAGDTTSSSAWGCGFWQDCMLQSISSVSIQHEWAFGVGLVTVLQVMCVADSLPLSNLLCSWSLMLTALLSSIGMHALPDFAIQQFAATSLP